MTYEELIEHFPGGKQTDRGEYVVCCTAHDDRKASLGIKIGKNGGIVMNCLAGCTNFDILKSVGLKLSDLMPPGVNGSAPRYVARYRYDDEQGHEVATKHRAAGKKFTWRQANGEWNLHGVTLPLFRAPELLKAPPGEPVLVVEGEKDVETAERLGFVATTNPEGAAREGKPKWKPEYGEWLATRLPGRHFYVIPDNDPAGEQHAAAVLASLLQYGATAHLLVLPDLPPKGDLSDWRAEGHTAVELRDLVLAASRNGTTPTPNPSFASCASFALRRQIEKPPAALEPEALYGLPGEVVKTIDPHTESHPAAVLANFLVGAGCLMGRWPHVFRDGARHAANEFACLVGLSAVGRKGTATRRTDEIFRSWFSSNNNSINSNYTKLTTCHEEAEEDLWEELLLKGLGSGEAMIEALADKDSDRRRLIFEEEFSKPLKVMRREGSTLSETLRSAWDGSILSNRTKGKHLLATNTHIAIMGHITETEFRLSLTSAELFNGFANRFLWFCVNRSKSLPFGGGEVPMTRLIHHLNEAMQYSKKITRMEFDDETKELWAEGGVYDLLIDRPAGLLGAVTGRAEAHVTRLALLYALLDLDREIRVDHLLAALAVWDFSEKSCAYLFGRSSGDDIADRIEEELWEVHPGGLSRTEISNLFQRHVPAGSIQKALGLLSDQGKVTTRMLETPGRSAELWLAKTAAKSEGSEICERSPLLRARKLLGRETR